MRNKHLYLLLLSLTYLVLNTSRSANGQTIYNEGSIISVTQSSIVTVDDFTNNGMVINNGRILVSGVWQNNAEYEPGLGVLSLFGSQRQQVNHNAQTFTRLEISGGGEKVFGADLTIQEELILSDGFLISENDSKLIFEENTLITGGGDNSYVDGPVVHTGIGTKLYPLGTNTTYYPITLTEESNAALALEVVLQIPNPGSRFSGILQGVTDNVAWQLNELSGQWSGSRTEVTVRNESFNGSTLDLAVVQAEDESSSYMSLGQSDFGGDISNGSLVSQQIADLSLISYGYLSSEPTFPITVYNALSPNGDGLHDYLQIVNIEAYPGNSVFIYNRLGDLIYEVTDYDNSNPLKRFEGVGIGNYSDVPDGTYYYTIDPGTDEVKKISGFFVLKR